MINQSITRRNPHIMKRSTRNTAAAGIGGAIVVAGLLASAALVNAQTDEPAGDVDETTTTIEEPTTEETAPTNGAPTPPWGDGEAPWGDGEAPWGHGEPPFGRGGFGGEGSRGAGRS